MNIPKRDVLIREVGLRDGLQMAKDIMPTEDKLKWIQEEYEAGVGEIEVCSMVPAKLIPQFSDANAVISGALQYRGLIVSALVPNLKGADRAIKSGVHKLNYVLSVSESHNQANIRRSVQDSLDDFKRIASVIKSITSGSRPLLVGGLSTAFGCTIEGKISEVRVIDLASQLIDAGADELTVADTVGYADPIMVRQMFSKLIKKFPNVPIAAHFHDTRGLGLANVMAALETGIRLFDASIGGLGGCPHAPGATGNVVTEDLAYLCKSTGYETGIDIEKLVSVRKIIASSIPNEPLFGNLARAGLPKW
jgi:hydroxymethylglutaryl-CoA lyase